MKNKPSRRQGVRRFVGIVSMLAFPLTLNWMSPYVSVAGAWSGIVSGSVLAFVGMFLSALIFGRSFCGWVCPAGVLQDFLRPVRNKRVKNHWLKYLVWGVWFVFLVLGFIRTWGPPNIQAFFLTDGGISVNRPEAFLTYYSVIFVFFAVALAVGRRGACHSICWMAPFMVGGRKVANLLRIPSLRLRSTADSCTSCGSCVSACPMSLNVTAMAKAEDMENADCIFCGECASTCPESVIRFGFGRR